MRFEVNDSFYDFDAIYYCVLTYLLTVFGVQNVTGQRLRLSQGRLIFVLIGLGSACTNHHIAL